MKSMPCVLFEQLIALYVEGDLRQSEKVPVESHLDGCASCRDLAANLRSSQSMFRTLRTGTVNTTALSDVRQRVLDKVGELDPAPAWVVALHRLFFAGLRHTTAIAGIAVVALVSGGVWYEKTLIVGERPVTPVVEVAKVDMPLVSVDHPVSNAPRQVAAVHPARKHVAISNVVLQEPPAAVVVEEPVAMKTESTLAAMKFLTDDPNIIIYWLPSDKGD